MRAHGNRRYNRVRVEGETAYIMLNDRAGRVVAEVVVDKADLPLVMRYNKWNLAKRGDVICQKTIKRKIISSKLHRVILNAPANKEVDHINRNPLDNRRSNLRLCSHDQNTKNLSLKRNNTSGHAGVRWVEQLGKWVARIKVDYQEKHLGVYETFEEAVATRKRAEKFYYGEFAP